MKIKRFLASDVRQALRQVKETLGADAVILSNKSVDGGVELVAALDYDEQTFTADSAEPQPEAMAPVTARSGSERPESGVKERTERRSSISPVDRGRDIDLAEMRQEMKALRRMMENQLSEITWQEMGSRRPQSQELLRRLMGLDISPDICLQLVDRVTDVEELDQAWRKALYSLAGDLPIVEESLIPGSAGHYIQ